MSLPAWPGTRTSGVTPAPMAAVQIADVDSKEIGLCSMST
jgi:hypothetical protein